MDDEPPDLRRPLDIYLGINAAGINFSQNSETGNYRPFGFFFQEEETKAITEEESWRCPPYKSI